MAKSAGICRIRAASRHAHAPLDLPARTNTLRGIVVRSDLGPYMRGGLRPSASFGCKACFYVKHRFSWVMSGNAKSHPRVAVNVLILFCILVAGGRIDLDRTSEEFLIGTGRTKRFL
jgi:hypothetical protein